MKHAWIGIVFLAFASTAATIRVTDSITQAVAQARAGDTILISGPAVFHEHVFIEKQLQLVGINSPTIDADGTGTPIVIRADGVGISGITVRNGGRDLSKADSGILIDASQALVEYCRVDGGAFGIYLHGAHNCGVANNVVVGDTNLPPAQRGNGIHLWNSKSNSIVGNFITNTRDGAYFSYADRNLIASNRIEQTRFGIHYMYSHENRLIGNTLTRNAVGAALMFARNCEVAGNRAFANRRHGILLKQVEHSHFARNTIVGQNRGFFIQQTVGNRFERNEISQNDVGLYLSNGSEENVFTGNAFIDNTEQVWQPTDEFEKGRLASNQFSERGRGNFWSDYTGNDANHDGIGDTPYHQTDTFGYIVNRHPEARVFALSPATALLRKGEELLPLLDTQGVTDPAPLMQPAANRVDVSKLAWSTSEKNNQSLLTSATTN
jgi:nitrous oxidase accessory protein